MTYYQPVVIQAQNKDPFDIRGNYFKDLDVGHVKSFSDYCKGKGVRVVDSSKAVYGQPPFNCYGVAELGGSFAMLCASERFFTNRGCNKLDANTFFEEYSGV